MIIKQATKHDYNNICLIAEQFRQEHYKYSKSHEAVMKSLSKTIPMMLNGAGLALLAEEDDGTPVGALLTIMTPNMWDFDEYNLTELMFYIMPDKRNLGIGAQLLNKYIEISTQMVESGRISYFTMAQTSRTNINYEKYGFELSETIYIRGDN